jgi:hypothetical protein
VLVSVGCVRCVGGLWFGRGYRGGRQLGLLGHLAFWLSGLHEVGNMGMSLLLVNDLDEMYGIA